MEKCKIRKWILWLMLICFTLSFTAEIRAEESHAVSLDPVTVTATKTTVDEGLTPVTAYTVDRADIEAQPSHYMNNFGEYIRDVPGVHVAQYYPWGPPWVHLRGTGHFLQRSVYLIDGIPVHAFLSTVVSANDIEKVDVVLGPSSSLYGASAAGGAVNIITRSGKSGDGAAAAMSYGSNNTFRPHVSAGDDNGKFHYRLSYSGDYSDGYKMIPMDGMVKLHGLGKKQYVRQASVEDNEYKHTWFSGKTGWRGDNGARVDLSVNYLERYLYGGQPNYIINDYGDTLVSSLRMVYPLGEFGRLTAATGYQFQNIPSQETTGASLVDRAVVVNPTITQRTEWDRRRIPFEVQGDFYLGSSNVLTTGLSWAREEEERPRFSGSTGEQIYRYDLTTDMLGVYLQDQAFFMDDRLSVLAGIRYDEWKYKDIYDTGSSDKTPDDVKKDQVTYRAGVKFKVNDMVSLRSSGGTAFWPGNPIWFFQNLNTGPTWREANPDLDPEKTWMADLGTDLTFAESGTLIRATGYYGIIEDIAAYTYDEHPTEPNTTLIRTRNIGEAEIYGLELYLSQPVTKRLSFTGSLTLNHSRITRDEVNPANEGNQLRNSPDYWGSLGLRYIHPELVNGEILFRFSDDRFYDDNNERLPYFEMDAYETVDVKIWRDWKLSRQWLLHTGISVVNVFDQIYPTEIVYVNPGRYAEGTAGIRYLF
jgi:iron complex outermembrane recepter protein